jgi:endonuclease YncB( thermonuclease family)
VADILRNGQHINRRMVRVGQAFAYRRHLKNCDSAAYLGADKAAETARLGAWADWTEGLPAGDDDLLDTTGLERQAI